MNVRQTRKLTRVRSPLGQSALVTGGFVLAGTSVIAWIRDDPETVFAGVSIAFAMYFVVLWLSYRRAARAIDEPTFTLASAITAFRGAAAVLLGAFLVGAWPMGVMSWLPAILVVITTVVDWLDGYVARRLDAVSTFGAEFDVEIDSFAVLIGTIVAVRLGVAPAIFIAIGLFRYGFLLGQWIRLRRDLPVFDLPPRSRRKYVGALAMIAVFLVVVPVFPTTVTYLLATAALVPLTYSFGIDWLYVSGRLTPAES